ncbi:hypothetical protein HK102_005718 [Quaeritorhiza haematococci]|nr:hypothetical protein HK102_005718 [Quaeritorhiza haematococci]
MFYSKDLLTNQKTSGLAIVWLAATLGSRSTYKKLSKKEVNGVNIMKACEFLTTPPEPMALRLTSNLLVGVARLLGAQYTFYLTDVNQVFVRLKRAFTELQHADVNMPVATAKFDAITMDHDVDSEISREPPLILQSALDKRQVDFGWVIRFEEPPSSQRSSSATRSQTDSNSPPSIAGVSSNDTSHCVGSLKSITLADKDFLDTTMHEEEDQFLQEALTHSQHMNDFILNDDELNFDNLLFDVDMSEHPKTIKEKKRADGKQQPDLDEWTLDFQPLQDEPELNLLPQNDDALLDPLDHNVSISEESLLGAFEEIAPPKHGGDNQEDGEVPFEKAGRLKLARPSKKRKKQYIVDDEIELSHSEMVSMRKCASIDTKMAYQEALKKRRDEQDAAFLKSCLRQPGLLGAPSLIEFWEDTVLCRNDRSKDTIPGGAIRKLTVPPLDENEQFIAPGAERFVDGRFESIEDPEIFRAAADDHRQSMISDTASASMMGDFGKDSLHDSNSSIAMEFTFEKVRRYLKAVASLLRAFGGGH